MYKCTQMSETHKKFVALLNLLTDEQKVQLLDYLKSIEEERVKQS